ncbi:hypothetical protein PG994_012686 [Apiospora phragmitis]|uniref:Uncharacterized protein n=1 Tax=Apiospora phragmitis TaxID=2905665 RepID=A0ABR1TDS8_9PEZI
MYKDRFKLWSWSKNVPHKKVAWMQNKLDECKPQKIVFQYHDMEQSEERLKKLLDARKQADEKISVAGATPQASNEAEAPTDDIAKVAFNYDAEPEGFSLRSMNMDDLRTSLQSASEAASAGKHAEAEKMFRDGLVGFRRLLTPTHDETLRAGYQLVSFYANLGKMGDADTVLDWMTSKHVEKWEGGMKRPWPTTHA